MLKLEEEFILFAAHTEKKIRMYTRTKKNRGGFTQSARKWLNIRPLDPGLLRSLFFGMSSNAPPKKSWEIYETAAVGKHGEPTFLWGERCVTSQKKAAKETT